MEKQNDTIIEKLLPRLGDYLNLFDYKSNGDFIKRKGDFFTCINPDHKDNNPSCSVGGKKGDFLFRCFSCDVGKGNIFHAAHFLEGLPIHGIEFFTITVPSLAKRFGIPYEPRELSQDEKEKIIHLNLIKDVSEIINSFVIDKWDTEEEHVKIVKERSLTKETVITYKIGAIPSIEEFHKKLLVKGWSKEYLQEKHIIEVPHNNNIFKPGKLIITISDMKGRPVAFVARQSNWDKDGQIPKYVNSVSSQIYSKDQTLFGFDVAKKYSKNKPLYVVEGYIDAITMHQHGIKNVVALGSAGFSEKLIEVIDQRNSFIERYTPKGESKLNSFILCFDGDEAGAACTRSAIELLDHAAKNYIINIKQLPHTVGFHDPDEIIRKSGVKIFNEIEELTHFKWDLKYKDIGNENEETFIKRVCNTIAGVDSPIERRSKARDLHEVLSSKGTIFTVDDIIKEVDIHRGNLDSKMNTELEMIFDNMIRKKSSHKGIQLVELLSSAYADIKKKHKDYNQRFGNVDDNYRKQIDEVRKSFGKTRSLNGFKLNRFKKLQDIFDGFPDSECLFSIAGGPNIGKSSFIREISWDLAQSNDDAIVLYMSIDDSYRDVLQAIVAREANVSRDKVYKYGLYCAEKGYDCDLVRDIDDAWDVVTKQQNYIVADATQGSSMMHLEDHLSYIKANYPNKKPIIFLDNFHKLKYSNDIAVREKFINMSQNLKELTQIEDIPIVMTVELRKTEHGKRPTLSDIAETIQIEYDSKVVMLAYQEMHHNKDTKVRWQRDNYDSDSVYLPYLEFDIAKNKHTDKKPYIGYRFEPDRSILTEVDYSEIQSKRSVNNQ